MELHVYAYEGNEEQVTDYLKRGYDVNMKDEDAGGRTPLHWAVSRHNVECCRLLLLNGADPNAPMYSGFTAVHTAAQVGYADAMKLLLDSGGDAGRLDKSGDSPLVVAERYGSKACSEMLIGARAKQQHRATPLSTSALAVVSAKKHDYTCKDKGNCSESCGCTMYDSDDDLKPFALVPGQPFREPVREEKPTKNLLRQLVKQQNSHGNPAQAATTAKNQKAERKMFGKSERRSGGRG